MVRGGPANRAVKRAKIFAITKGFRGRRKNCYSLAIRAAHKALQYAYVGRKLKKRDMRKLWIQRINFGAQSHNINYSTFMNNLVKCNIQLNRKVLCELAIHEPKSFEAIAEVAKQRWRHDSVCSLNEDFKESIDSELPSRQTSNPTSILYRTNRVVDRMTGRVVMETAV